MVDWLQVICCRCIDIKVTWWLQLGCFTMHTLFLMDTWVLPHGSGTVSGTSLSLSHSRSRSHTHAFRHLRLWVWTLWRMCRKCTQPHKLLLCYLCHSDHENYFWTSNSLSPWHIQYTSTTLSPALPSSLTRSRSFSPSCSPFSLPSHPSWRSPWTQREITLTRKTRAGSCSCFPSACLLSLAFESVEEHASSIILLSPLSRCLHFGHSFPGLFSLFVFVK